MLSAFRSLSMPGGRMSALAAVLGIVVVIYASTLTGEFQGDDSKYILDNPVVNGTGSLEEVRRRDPEIYKNVILRSVSYLTFAANFRLHGARTGGYHAVNIALHAASAALFLLLAGSLFRTPVLKRSPLAGHGDGLAASAALLFAVHPVQTEAVNYILQRMALLAGFFSLLATFAYVRWRLLSGEEKGEAVRRGGGAGWYGLAVAASVLAMLSKENAFSLPFIIVLAESLFFEGAARRRLVRLLPILLTALIIPTATAAMMAKTGLDLDEFTRSAERIGQPEYLLTQFRVVLTYLRLLFAPVNQTFFYDYPIYHSLAQPAVLGSFLVLLTLVLLAIYLVVRASRSEPAWRVVAYGIFWFFLALSVESSLIALPQVIFEYRLYLPSAGFFLAVVPGAALLLRTRIRPGQVAAAFVIAALVLAGSAIARNRIWENNIRLWEDTARKSLGRALVHNNLGNAYAAARRFDDAIRSYRLALQVDPRYIKAYYNLAQVLGRQGKEQEALEVYRTVLRVDPSSAQRFFNPVAVMEGGHAVPPPGINERARELYNQGILYAREGNYQDGIRALSEVVQIQPRNAEAHFNLGSLYIQIGQMAKAVKAYEDALASNPNHAGAHMNLGGAYAELGRYDDAMRELETALRIDPSLEDARYNLQLVREMLTSRKRKP